MGAGAGSDHKGWGSQGPVVVTGGWGSQGLVMVPGSGAQGRVVVPGCCCLRGQQWPYG